jgi:hypothetical protein
MQGKTEYRKKVNAKLINAADVRKNPFALFRPHILTD